MSSSALTPEDMNYFDISPEEEEVEDEVPPKKRFIFLSLALILFFIGFSLAPPSFSDGTYDVTLSYNDEINIEFEIELNSDLIEATGKQSKILEVADTRVNITYFATYPGSSGSKLNFLFLFTGVLTSELDIVDFTGSLDGKGISHDFIAKELDDNTAIYSFTILKHTGYAMGLLFAISFLWLTEAIPLAASSLMIPVVLVFLDISTATAALSDFSQPIIFLFLAGFLMAEAMKRTKLDLFIAYRIFSFIPPNGKILMFSMMLLAAVFSMFMSNTAACAILIPLTIQLLKGVEIENPKYRQAVILGIAYASTVGGIGSLIGTPPNIIAAQLLYQFDPRYQITFAEWFLFGLPVVIVMLPTVFFYLWWRFKPSVDVELLKASQVQTKIIVTEEHQLTKEQLGVSIIFMLIFGLWLTSNIHGISSGIVALLGAVLLYIAGQLKESDLNKINWNALLTFGGGLTLGGLIIKTGLADYIGSKSIFIVDYPIIVILLVFATIGLILTAFASNTASAVILVPIVMPLGYVLGVSPMLLAVVVAIAASVDFAIVIGTPPTMIAYSTGLFEVKDIFRIGIVLDLIGLIVVTLLSYLLFSAIVLLII